MVTKEQFEKYCKIHGLILRDHAWLVEQDGVQEWEGTLLAAQYTETLDFQPVYAAFLTDEGEVDVIAKWNGPDGDEVRRVLEKTFVAALAPKPLHATWGE